MTVQQLVHTVNETCEVLRVSRTTLRALEETGELVPIRISQRAVRYRREDIERYLKSLATKRKSRCKK
jgi:excisionase family DNA binding protein